MPKVVNLKACPRGMTLLEIACAMALLTVGLLGLLQVTTTTFLVNDINREESLALEAARLKITEMQTVAFDSVFATYNATANRTFTVSSLSNGLGTIVFPKNGTTDLREDDGTKDLGLPHDLNGDGVIDANSHSLDYENLPFKIQISWTSLTGQRSLSFPTMLGRGSGI